MAARIIHRGPHSPKPERPEIVNVRAGGTVRMRLRLTDGGVALDWTDPRVRVRDVCVWSEPRRGVIAHPGFSFDADDPTLLVVEHTTSAADLPGIHRLVVDVSFTGWAAAHTIVAYNLVNSLALAGGDIQAAERWGVEEVSLQLHLHDVSTTWLQHLIDLLLKLRVSENERITALEVLTETLRNEVDKLTGRMETAEGDIQKNAEDIGALEKRMEIAEGGLDDLGKRMDEAEGNIGELMEGMTTLTQTVTNLVECCKKVQQTLENLEERVRKLEEGGTPDPEYATLAITPDPSDATVVINGEERTELTAEVGTEIEWSVSKEGYVTQSGTLTLTEDKTLNITLVGEDVVYSDIEITEFSYGDIPASGGTATPTLKYRQTWGYGSETGGGVIEDGAEVSYEGVEGDGSHTEGSLGTTARERTQVATASVTVTLNGKTATASAEVWQSENKVEKYSGLHWIDWEGEKDFTYESNATIANLIGFVPARQRIDYTSGAYTFDNVAMSNISFAEVEGCDWATLSGYTLTLTQNTSGERRGPYDIVETCDSEGETISRTWHVYQEGVEEVERTITFKVSPTDATLTVNGSEVTLSGGTYTMTAKDGDEISWSCGCDGYVSQSGSHTVDGDATITITLEEEDAHYITVEPSTLSFTGIARSTVTVSSDGAWTAESDSDWLTLGTYSGEAGETSVAVSAANPDSSRIASVTFTSEHGKTASLFVSQFHVSGGGTGGDDPDPEENPDTITASKGSVASGEEFTLVLTGTTATLDATLTNMSATVGTVYLTLDGGTYELNTQTTSIPVAANSTYRCVLESSFSESISVFFAHGDASVTVQVHNSLTGNSDTENYSDGGVNE